MKSFLKLICIVLMLCWLGGCGAGIYLEDDKMQSAGAFCFFAMFLIAWVGSGDGNEQD